MKKFFLIGAIVLACLAPTNGQGKKGGDGINRACVSLQERVIRPQKPAKLLREYKSSSGCSFDYAFDEVGNVRFRFDRFRTRSEASLEQESLVGRLTKLDGNLGSRKYENVELKGFWDSSAAYADNAGTNHFLVVRRGKYLVVVYSASFPMLRETERLLRSVDFN